MLPSLAAVFPLYFSPQKTLAGSSGRNPAPPQHRYPASVVSAEERYSSLGLASLPEQALGVASLSIPAIRGDRLPDRPLARLSFLRPSLRQDAWQGDKSVDAYEQTQAPPDSHHC